MYKKSRVLKELRKELEGGARMGVALKRVGVRSADTLSLWRRRPLIDRYVDTCVRRGNDRRDDAVEDGFTKKLIEGRGNASDYEFYLTNRRPEQWQKRNVIINNTNVLNNITDPEKALLRSMPEKDIDALSGRLIERRQSSAA
jgi:hypothetical protein